LTEEKIFDVIGVGSAAHSFSKVRRAAKCVVGAANFVTVKDEHNNE